MPVRWFECRCRNREGGARVRGLTVRYCLLDVHLSEISAASPWFEWVVSRPVIESKKIFKQIPAFVRFLSGYGYY